jgi:hypothetical protein
MCDPKVLIAGSGTIIQQPKSASLCIDRLNLTDECSDSPYEMLNRGDKIHLTEVIGKMLEVFRNEGVQRAEIGQDISRISSTFMRIFLALDLKGWG